MILSTFFINKKYIIDFRFIVIGSSKLNELNFNIIFLLNNFPKKIKRNEIEVNPWIWIISIVLKIFKNK